MDPTTLTVDSLAAYRLVRLIQRDTLPPLPELRDRVLDQHGHRPWAELLECPWCAGFHVAVLVRVARALAPRLWGPLAAALAASAAVGLLTSAEDALGA